MILSGSIWLGSNRQNSSIRFENYSNWSLWFNLKFYLESNQIESYVSLVFLPINKGEPRTVFLSKFSVMLLLFVSFTVSVNASDDHDIPPRGVHWKHRPSYHYRPTKNWINGNHIFFVLSHHFFLFLFLWYQVYVYYTRSLFVHLDERHNVI